MRRKWVLILFILCQVSYAQPYLQEDFLPVPSQYQLILKVLTFDRNLRKRAGDEIVLGIVYQKEWNTSQNIKDGLVKVMVESSPRELEGIPIRQVAIEFRDKNDFSFKMAIGKVNILYVAPVSPPVLKAILDVCRARRIPTFTGVPSFIERGVAVGFRKRGTHAEILINFQSAREQGFNFSSRLLHISRLFGKLE